MEALTAVQVGARWFSENPGDLDRYYHDLLDALPDAGVVCRGLVVGSGEVEQETDGAVRAFALPDAPLLRRWRGVRSAVTRVWKSLPGPDGRVLVTHFALYAYPLIKDHDGRPWVVHFHGPWADEPRREGVSGVMSWMKRRVERAVYREADRIVVLSEAFRDLLRDRYDVPCDRIDVIPGGVDVGRFAAASATERAVARQQFGWPVDRPTVLSVRRLTSKMGLEALIDAMATVRKTVPNALCLIAGRGPLVEKLAEKINVAGLDDTVKLLGFVADEDLPLAYRAADVTVMPSESFEGFALAAAESLAAGTPALVTPVGGLPEVVGGLDPKLILPDASAASIAAGLARALADPASLPGTEACRAYAARTFDWQVIAARIAGVYAKAARTATAGVGRDEMSPSLRPGVRV